MSSSTFLTMIFTFGTVFGGLIFMLAYLFSKKQIAEEE